MYQNCLMMNPQVQAIRQLILSNDIANVRLGVALKQSITDWNNEMEGEFKMDLECHYCFMPSHFFSGKKSILLCNSCFMMIHDNMVLSLYEPIVEISGYPNLTTRQS